MTQKQKNALYALLGVLVKENKPADSMPDELWRAVKEATPLREYLLKH